MTAAPHSPLVEAVEVAIAEELHLIPHGTPWEDKAVRLARVALEASHAEELRVALANLLEDIQHCDHDCGETPENCPVLSARALLAMLGGGS